VGGCGGANLAVFESTSFSFAPDSDGDEGGLAATVAAILIVVFSFIGGVVTKKKNLFVESNFTVKKQKFIVFAIPTRCTHASPGVATPTN
jgi:hypothetical protein